MGAWGVTPGDDGDAVVWYRAAARKGDARAMAALGYAYANGRGVVKDEKEAMGWFRKAADKGDAKAAFNLGVAYEQGHGVAKDRAEALSWYRKAAKLDREHQTAARLKVEQMEREK